METEFNAILIDDEDWIREGLIEHLRWADLGIRLDASFSDGREAQAFMKDHAVRLILSDIRMPHMNGLDLLRWVREQTELRSTQLIFLSGYGNFQYAQEALRLGAVDFLLKPAKSEIIEQALLRAKQLWLDDSERYRVWDVVRENSDLQRRIEQATAPEDKLYSRLVLRALNGMKERMAEDLQLAQLAEELFITPNYLGRLIRKETGRSFTEHLSDIRLQHARSLLETTMLKVYQIGDRVGISNSRYFSDWFQKLTGYTPVEYRKRFD